MEKVATFSTESRKCSREDERLWLDELNQILEGLGAGMNLHMDILSVKELDVALHNFVNKGDNMAFHSCLQNSLEEARESFKQRDSKLSDAKHFTSSGFSEKETSTDGSDRDISSSDSEDAKLGADCSDNDEPVQQREGNELLQLTKTSCSKEKKNN